MMIDVQVHIYIYTSIMLLFRAERFDSRDLKLHLKKVATKIIGFETRTTLTFELLRICFTSTNQTWWWCYPTLFRGMGAWTNSTETQQSDHALRSGPEVKNGRSVPKIACRRGSDAGQSRRRESDPVEGVRRRCMKNHEEFYK